MNTDHMIFVFGSNLRGVHGAGAAAYAHKHKGAVWGIGVGPSGQSYALPTKNSQIQTIELRLIKDFVDGFIDYTCENPSLDFQITAIGCGLAGYKHEDIAPLFKDAPVSNCYFDLLWQDILGSGKKYWGTF